jgi:hypothetical protein
VNHRNLVPRSILDERLKKRYSKKSKMPHALPSGYTLLDQGSILKGGGALPLRYFDPLAEQSSASSGHDLLTGDGIRPRIGGKRKRSTRKRTKGGFTKFAAKGGFTKFAAKGGFTKFAAKGGFTKFAAKGGFIPSIMEPFALACSKYIMPVAGLSAYKLFNNPTKKYRR